MVELVNSFLCELAGDSTTRLIVFQFLQQGSHRMSLKITEYRGENMVGHLSGQRHSKELETIILRVGLPKHIRPLVGTAHFFIKTR
jgi:hypothetical protein